MHDAFISYARSDGKELASRLTRALERAGKDVFVDLDDIPPASAWERDLRDGVANSSAFLFVITPGSVASQHCRRELDQAREANKRIIPVVGASVADPDVPIAVGTLNWVPQQGVFDDDFEAAFARLLQAIETDLEATREHTRWQARAEAWRAADRGRGLLAGGAELQAADRWLARAAGSAPEPTALQAEWIAAGRAAAARRQRLLFGGAVAALIVTAVLGVLALVARNEAVEQRQIARADELASDATANFESDPELSLILALEATRVRESERTVETLRRALLASRVRARVNAEAGAAADAATISPDGELLAAAFEDGTAGLWRVAGGEPVATLRTSAPFVSDVAFTPNGDRVLTFDGAGEVRAWSTADGSDLGGFAASSASLLSGAVSPDGRLVAVGDQDGAATVLSIDGRHPVRVDAGAEPVRSVEFSPDSRLVTTASQDRGARVWDASNGRLKLVVGDGAAAADAGFDSRGRALVVAHQDGSAAIYDARTGERDGRPLQQPDQGAFITRAAFVPGAEVVLTAGSGGEVAAWDRATHARIDQYRGHEGIVLDVEATADGAAVATAGADGSARIWDLGQRIATLDAPGATSPGFSADSAALAFADGLAEIADAASGRRLVQVSAGAPIFAARLRPDGEVLAAALGDGTVRLYDPRSGDPVGRPFEHGDDDLFALGWSADGARLMAAGHESPITVWDAESGELAGSLDPAGADGYLFDVALSPDGRTVAVVGATTETTSADSATLYGVDDGAVVRELSGHTDRLESVAYDPSGTQIATGSADNTARIWDAATGAQLRVLDNDGYAVRDVTFGGDGSLVATSSASDELRVWDAASGLAVLRLAGANAKVALSANASKVAGIDWRAGRLSLFDCDACAADLAELQALARQRITRELTPEERRLYLDR